MNYEGLKRKYIVTKADGSPMDPDAEYFVLRVDLHEPDDPAHYHACIKALTEYAHEIQHYNPNLSKDLRKRYIIPYIDRLLKTLERMTN